MDTSWHFDELSSSKFTSLSRTAQFLEETHSLGLSTYDNHGDGSGVAHGSRLRPMLNMRPKEDLWQFNADTHIIDWLAAKGLDCDIITDEDLEHEGLECLKPYRCVVTGTHPEYYSLKMLDAVQDYTDRGGRLMYLGANGFYWRIAWHPTLDGVIEHRRSEDGMRAWMTQPGESYMAFTGEYSGLWQRNGRPPNVLVGTAFSGQGFDFATYYKRLPASRDPRVSFIFEGVTDERVGDFGAVAEHFGRRQRSAGEPVIECLAFEILHHQIRTAFVIPDVKQGANVRVTERGNRAGLCFESRATIGSLGTVGVQDLDGYHAIESCIAGFVDLTHPAGPDHRQDLVRADPRTR
jgi:N,N-dimethylformamidase